MYQAIEAISKAGVVRPLEPVQFDDNEPLVILRLTKTFANPTPPAQSAVWQHWAGVLKSSPNLNGDPLTLQRDMRHEWD
jgi:predicted DNA-binding antitoxin AbrB/MazE fold protein